MRNKRPSRLFRTIKSRLIAVSLTFLALGTILPVQITSHIYLNQIQRKNEEETVSKFSYTERQIHEILSSSVTSAMSLYNKDEVYDYLSSAYKNEDFLQRTTDRISFLDAVSSYFKYNFDINAVLFFRDDGTMCGASSTWNFFMEEKAHPFYTNRVKGITGTKNNTVWLGAFPKTEFTLAPIRDHMMATDLMFCGLRKITYTLRSEESRDIVMLVSVKEEAIRNCFVYITDEDSSVCLLDASGALISGQDFAQFGTIPDYYGKIDPGSRYGSVNYAAEDGLDYQIVYYRLENPDWMLVKQSPVSVHYKSINLLRHISYAVGLVFVLLAAVLYSFWAIRFVRPLNQITQMLTQVQEGNLGIYIPETSGIDEIYGMQHHFNQMISSINGLLAQKEEDEREKMMLEVRNLQAQINPHFIYNSITSIRWMATLSGAEKVSDMLVVLSDLLHPVFSRWTPDWTLAEELGFSENYIKLMRLRYGNRVSMEVQTETGPYPSNKIKPPRLILQPLLENSCEHGILRNQSLHIQITVSYSPQKFIITVADDGAGFPADTLLRLNEGFAAASFSRPGESEKDGKGIGLINVNQRLRMRYGDGYGLTILDRAGRGSCIEIRIGTGDA